MEEGLARDLVGVLEEVELEEEEIAEMMALVVDLIEVGYLRDDLEGREVLGGLEHFQTSDLVEEVLVQLLDLVEEVPKLEFLPGEQASLTMMKMRTCLKLAMLCLQNKKILVTVKIRTRRSLNKRLTSQVNQKKEERDLTVLIITMKMITMDMTIRGMMTMMTTAWTHTTGRGTMDKRKRTTGECLCFTC